MHHMRISEWNLMQRTVEFMSGAKNRYCPSFAGLKKKRLFDKMWKKPGRLKSTVLQSHIIHILHVLIRLKHHFKLTAPPYT